MASVSQEQKQNKKTKNKINKHTESIAKAIQVPHRPQEIEICNHYFGALFNKEQLELLHFTQICESMADKSPKNEFGTKGNNSWKSRSTVTKV